MRRWESGWSRRWRRKEFRRSLGILGAMSSREDTGSAFAAAAMPLLEFLTRLVSPSEVLDALHAVFAYPGPSSFGGSYLPICLRRSRTSRM